MIKFLKNLLILLLINTSLFSLGSTNSYGQIGYINTPSAYTDKTATFGVGFLRSSPDRKINFMISPTDFFDATIFYVDITGKDYPGDFKQSYKDKGFNFKFRLYEHSNSAFSIGINDVAGTGLYSSEYLVFSQRKNRFEYSLGFGWGLYNSGLTFENPFKSLSNSFTERNRDIGLGGNFDMQSYFSGKKTSVFGAVSYDLNEKFKLIFELDPTNQSEEIGYDSKNKNINLAIDYSKKNYSVQVNSIGLKNISLQLTLKSNFLQFSSTPPNKITERISNNYQLQKALEENQIGLKEIKIEDNISEIIVRQNAYQNQYEANQRVYRTTRKFLKNEDLIITHDIHGMEVLKTYYKGNELRNIRNEVYTEVDLEKKIYQVNEEFPIIINSVTPSIRNYFAAREGFLFSGLLLEDNLEVILQENLIFLANFKYSIFDNFDDLYVPARDTYPNQVRSDNKDYLAKMSKNIVIGRLELNYFESFKRKHFIHFRAGIFEEMFGGYGFDYLYHPEGSIISYGAEFHKVYKRDYKMNFDFQNYSNSLLRVNVQATDPKTKLRFKLSYGEYLAGDKGYTLEIGKRLDNGVEFYGFFTRTNVTKVQFGEGSYDKGIKFRIPFNLFGKNKRLVNFEWHPLTKDPGALLIKSIKIQDEVDRYRVY